MESCALSTDDETKVRIACIQMQPTIGKVEDNVAHSIGLINRAVEQGAKFVVLPELSNTGYMFSSREEAFALSEPIPGGPTVKAWSEIAARHKLHLVAGICERDGTKLFNSAVLIGPYGYIGTFRKVHLWNEENLYFEPGDLGFPVYHTAIGRIGMAICYDGWFPETLSARGAAGRRHRLRADQLGADSRPGARRARRWPTSSRWLPRIPTRSTSPAPIASAPSAASPSKARA